MRVITKNKIDYHEITLCLKKGGVIIYPTDTAYALGADATNEAGVAKVFRIKSRDESKTLPLIVKSLEAAHEWAYFSASEEELAERYWPAPLTLILEAKDTALAKTVIKDGRVAMRVPDNKIAQELSLRLGAPLTATSANLSDSGTFYKIKDVVQSLAANINLVDYIIDAGDLPPQGLSTIARLEDGRIEVVRPGAIDLTMN